MTGQQLKNSILQLAIQGKLVPQDPNDEPASLLLERIRREKEKLIKEKKISADKNPSRIFRGVDGLFYEKIGKKEPVLIQDEIPFDIPESWEWVRFGQLAESIQYGYNAPAKDNGRIRMVRISDIQGNNVLWDAVPFCEIEEDEIKHYLLQTEDVLFARTGGTVGKSFLVEEIPYESIYAGYLIRARFSKLLFSKYLKYFMESVLYWQQLKNKTTATAQPNCNGQSLAKMFVPLPPTKEQKRIVEKLNKVLPLVDKYGEVEKELSDFNASFPKEMKKSILQYAIQGKLVPQNPEDEPASVLLERIRQEKKKLVKSGAIKKDKHESVIYKRDGSYFEKVDGKERCIDDEIPFDIPESWEWVRLSQISSVLNGDRGKNYPAKSVLTTSGIPFISALNLDGKTVVNDERLKCMTEHQYNALRNGKLKKGDIVVCIRGSLGKHGRFPFEKGAIASSLVILRPYCTEDIISEYIMNWLDAPLFLSEVSKYDNGTAQPNLAANNLEKFWMPIPPISEQKRIVEKLEAILPYLSFEDKTVVK